MSLYIHLSEKNAYLTLATDQFHPDIEDPTKIQKFFVECLDSWLSHRRNIEILREEIKNIDPFLLCKRSSTFLLRIRISQEIFWKMLNSGNYRRTLEIFEQDITNWMIYPRIIEYLEPHKFGTPEREE